MDNNETNNLAEAMDNLEDNPDTESEERSEGDSPDPGIKDHIAGLNIDEEEDLNNTNVEGEKKGLLADHSELSILKNY